MNEQSEKLSALLDNEIDDNQCIEQLMNDQEQLDQFSRYNLIGSVMRDEVSEQVLEIDISQQVMQKIADQPMDNVVSLDTTANQPETKSNVISFTKRFGQYAIAASVSAVVVLASVMTAQPTVDSNGQQIEVLNTVPFGGAAAPVSLQATPQQVKHAAKERNERLEALLKDHQLQPQTQP